MRRPAILLNFLAGAPARTAQKDRQDVPVRQTLPPPQPGLDRIKTRQKREKFRRRNGMGLATVCPEQSIRIIAP
jgi:hypothetical protein